MAIRVLYTKELQEKTKANGDYIPTGVYYIEFPDGSLEVFDKYGNFIKHYAAGEYKTVNIEN